MYIVELVNDKTITAIHNESTKLKSGSIVQGINTIDSLSFSVYPSSPGFNKIYDYKTLIRVYNTRKKRYVFFGRILYSSISMEESGSIEKKAVCESYLGFLCDSQQPYVEEKNWTVSGLLEYLINQHNSQVESYKHFSIGEVTVTDPNDNLYLGIQRDNTWKAINEKLIDKLGGEIQFRVSDDVTYIDYLTEIGAARATTIELSKNMKTITRENDPTDYITRLIPLGTKLSKEVTETDENGKKTIKTVETEERLEITSVNDSKNYLDDETAISVYGIHVGYQIWDDVTTASALLKKGQDYLIEKNRVKTKYSITALDLSLLGIDIDDLAAGDKYPVINPLLGIDDTARIIKKTTNICNEIESTVEVGDSFKTLTDLLYERNSSIKDSVNKVENTVNTLKDKVSSVQNSVNALVTRVEGINGIFFYIRYSAYPDGHIMTTEPQSDTKYMGVCSTNEETAPTDYAAYTWSLIQGEDGKDGTPGINGKDGVSQYIHIKYSDDGETFTANDGEELGDWMGTCVNSAQPDPADFDAYEWHKIRGEAGLPGADGIPGTDGKDGATTYFHIKYSNVENPASASQMTETPSKYIGTYVDYTEADSDNPSDYKWMKFQGSDGIDGKDGEQGIPGENGKDGQTHYLHIKYSDDGGETFTSNNGEEPGDWMGVYTDTTQADSADVTAYTWTKIKGEPGPKGNKGEDGTSVTIKGSVGTAGELPASGNTAGDGYIVNGDLCVWDGEKWNNVGAIQGPAGESAYMHIKYSDDGGRTFTANNGETAGSYFGTYADNTEKDSDDPADYRWVKMEGTDGADGKDGITYYTWIKYADSPTSGMSDSPDGKVYMGMAYNKTTAAESTNYGDYTWSLIKGEDGSDGINGVDGIDGKTYYTWVKYASSENGTNMSDDPTGKDYIGLAYNKDTPNESSDPADYTWSLFRGKDGVDGKDGADGISQYFYIRFSANANGNPMTANPASDTKYMGVCSTTSPTAPTAYSSYTWTQCRGNDGTDGTPGAPGADGRTQYLHIKYSDDGETFTANQGEELGAWIGTLVDFNEKDSTVFSDYTWKKFTGDITVGGRNLIRDSSMESGIGWGNLDYIIDNEGIDGGACFKVPGEIGVDRHIAQLESIQDELIAEGFFLPGEEYTASFWAKAENLVYGTTNPFVGIYIAYTQDGRWVAESILVNCIPSGNSEWTRYNVVFTVPTSVVFDVVRPVNIYFRDFSGTVWIDRIQLERGNLLTDWKPAPEDIDGKIDSEVTEIRQTITEQTTSLTNTCSEIVLEALQSYTEKGQFDSFRETTESELAVLADEIAMKFTETIEQVETVNGELQSQINTITKYFTFSTDGLTIGQEESPYKMVLDNDRLTFYVNEVEVLWIDSETREVHTPNLTVTESFNFFGFRVEQDANGNINWDYMGG